VPLFGDIPVVGNLFKTTARTNDKTELLIFLTPKIIDDKVVIR
jgi:type IV pilus assembly protein PilQ